MKSPYLYLSLFFKQHRSLYYDKLDRVRFEEDWEAWINFFLEGIVEISKDARHILEALQKLFKNDEDAVNRIVRARISALRVLGQFRLKPVLSITEIMSGTGYSRPTVISAVNRLITLDIVGPVEEKRTLQLYSYKKFVQLLGE